MLQSAWKYSVYADNRKLDIKFRNKYYCYKKKNIIRKIVFKENYDYKQTIKNFFEGKCHITGNTQFPHEMISDLENNKDLVINNNSS